MLPSSDYYDERFNDLEVSNSILEEKLSEAKATIAELEVELRECKALLTARTEQRDAYREAIKSL